MKTQFKSLFSAAAFLLAGTVAMAQSDAEEVPGDNFSLEGALELFKKSASPQEFEQLLNSPDSKVNNLDLNGDGDIDYIRVIDKNEGNVHAFILQAVVSANESQDVAVIELEKRSNGKAVLQIVGDADIYGIETIIEPTEEVRVNAGTTTSRTVVNVWAWPSVQYIYGPSYALWVSPWGWRYYPGWYRPWRPIAWRYYDPFWAPYRPYYSVCFRHRIVYAPAIYRPYRATSVIVHNRSYTQINHFRNTSQGYRHDRGGDYARGARSNSYSSGQRSGYSHGQRSSYTNGQRSRNDYNRSNGYRSDNSNRTSREYSSPREFRSTPQRSRSNESMSHNFNRGGSGNSGRQSQAPVQRQFSAPSHRQFSPPSHAGGGGGRQAAPQHSGGHSGGGRRH